MKSKKVKKELLQQRLMEMLKCKKDPIYFIENYIYEPVGDKIEKIKLREKQKEIIKTILEHHYLILNGSRQVGKTKVIQWFIIWLACFHDNYEVFVLSKKSDSTKDLLREIQMIYDLLPDWIKPKQIKNNALEKVFDNNSRIKGITVSKGNAKEAGRGLRGGFIFIDEVAFFDADIEEVVTAMLGTTTNVFMRYKELGYPYGIALVSTPNGMTGKGEFFFKLWTKALSGESIFKPIKYHWSDVPEYRNDPSWIEEQKRKMPSERKFNQEYELVFLGTEDAFLPDKVIETLQSLDFDIIREVRGVYGSLDVYVPIDPTRYYLIGIDPATERGEDNSAIVIMDYETCDCVAEYLHKLPVEDFVVDIVEIMKQLHLRNYLLIPEAVGVGITAVSLLKKFFPLSKIYKEKSSKSKIEYGIATNKINRPLMLDAVYHLVTSNPLIVKPKKLRNELISIEYNSKLSRFEAPSGLHDDLVLAMSFCAYVRQYAKVAARNVTLIDDETLKEANKKVASYYRQRYNRPKIITGNSFGSKNTYGFDFESKNYIITGEDLWL
jgi:hypothetical protein